MPQILHVVSYFPPDRLGGVGEVVAHIHRGLKSAGHESTVLTSGVSREDESVIRVARSPAWFSLGVLSQLSLARKADVVHIHHGEGVLLLLAMKMLCIRTPVLVTMHVSVSAMRRSLGPYSSSGRRFCRDSVGRWFYRHITMRFRSIMDWLALRLSTQTSFISRSSARDTLSPIASADATVIYNGVELLDEAYGDSSTPVDLLFVGTNTERKRVELLPLVLAAAMKRRPQTRMRIVGFDRSDNPELCRIASELGVLDAIEFAGSFPSTELGQQYLAARVLLVPSAYEGLPMVILEAMQFNLPVVATRVSGHPEVIENEVSGLLVPLDDPQAMALSALRLLEDQALAARIALAARKRVEEEFSVAGQVDAYLTLYQMLAGYSSV